MSGPSIVGAIVMTTFVGAAALQAQLPLRPMVPQHETGNRVSPFFEGWYSNPDGTHSLSFGFSNMNKDTVEIPLGPDNFITPKEFDGAQPTIFPVADGDADDSGGGVVPVPSGTVSGADQRGGPAPGTSDGGRANRGGGFGPNINRHDRERGSFTVTVPKDFKGDVVWTLKHAGQTWSVPGRSTRNEYMLSWPMAMGSAPPLVSFKPGGPAGRGPMGIKGTPVRAKVGDPVELTVYAVDDAEHEKEPITVKREARPSMNAAWIPHRTPTGAQVTFEPARQGVTSPQGKVTTKATFSEPGEYLIRARVDAHGNLDSSFANQCCWTNGYIPVTVTR